MGAFLFAFINNVVITPHITNATPSSTIDATELRKCHEVLISEICFSATATLPLKTVTPYKIRIRAGSTYLVAVAPN